MRKPKVLLTGFEPFDNSSFNISEKLVTEIERLNLNEYEIKTKILTVNEEGSKIVSELIPYEDYDFILHLGFSNNAKKIHLESRAVNKINMNIKDNSGRELKNKLIVNDDLDEYISTVNIEVFNEDSPVDFLISSDAGTFVCNETYFRTLKTINSNQIKDRFNRTLPCLFVHLPSEKFIQISDQIKMILWILKSVVDKKIIDVVAAIISNKNGDVLVAKRDSKQPHPGKWEFPGGKLKHNEGVKEGLKREILEELMIDIDILSPCGEVQHLYEEYFVNLKAMNAKINQNSPQLKLIVHDEVLWMKKENLETLDWLEANIKLIKIIQNQS
ncbi:MAG: hypothetical protein CMB48_00785 [Euryarchaeota archaeon]|nr:hypothetical protein [Euryarchaeota archaeon]|tara:strand:- start:4400 stop:5386 length:987 start_codon:yes stop_codon:yes gene_type:complete